MKNSVELVCSISTTNIASPLGIEIWLDNQKLLDVEHVIDPVAFSHEFSDDEANHVLIFKMKNKTPDSTVLDGSGQIVSDSCLIIEKVSFDGIELQQVFFDTATYTHNYNGNGLDVTEKFYGKMGCNGQVQLDFTAPVYLWLLEHM
jgi:hypothetical protein